MAILVDAYAKVKEEARDSGKIALALCVMMTLALCVMMTLALCVMMTLALYVMMTSYVLHLHCRCQHISTLMRVLHTALSSETSIVVKSSCA